MQLKNIGRGHTLTVNGDPDRVISFNPSDVGFVDRYFTMLDRFEEKEGEYRAKLAEIEQDKAVDGYGIPLAARRAAKLSKEVCAFMRRQIDEVFGEGTSQTAFGDANVPEMFGEFFDGIAPHIAKAREAAVSKYTKTRGGGPS